MISAFIAAMLAVIVYSLWVRRDTWWSRWEVAATFALAMEGCALLLLSPWAGHTLGPMLHQYLHLWNVQQLLGIICLIVAVTANTYHMLVRLADPDHVLPIMRKHLLAPLGLGVVVMVATFVKTERGHQPDIFAGLTGDAWQTGYEVAVCAMAIYLSCYLSRLMLLLRHDPRAKTTVNLYLASMAFAVAACLIGFGSIWVGAYAGTAIWACICISVGIFAYGLAQSWQAKQAWFSPEARTNR
ncbi:hypothetical protein [[Mycobacterium] nativiensis]|uniref:GP55 protein n=1 Tax=[Mycobacterium] nativiensis TaxID=2855503 RepID=A0ABU5Y3N6_9MYCO|nr:hypothetical protein [Mycolicibacter sp. MYC340]MEB3034825.1 hypothetical protein [Mycolicibacter sp. MYC340]